MEYQPPTPPTPPQPPYPGSAGGGPGKTSMGLEPNLAAALSYVCCWITGIVFFLLEKEDNFVRFHAMQSIIAFAAITILFIVFEIISFLPTFLFDIISMIGFGVLSILQLIVFLVCVIKAYQGERFHLPVVGEMAEKYVR